MWKNWFLGFVGLWLVLLGFSGFPAKTLKILIIISGIVVAFLSFKSVSRHKVNESIKHLSFDESQDKPDEPEDFNPEDQQPPLS